MAGLIKQRSAQIVAVVGIAYLLYYLGWRVWSTLNPQAPLFSWLFLLAEIYGVVSLLLFVFMTWDVDQRSPFHLSPGWSVDVFVPTYNEDLDIIEATLVGCQLMTYPHVTYVLDDGRRKEVAGLAERLGCRYLTRPDNRDAKAGNLNAALARTSGEFIVVLDADTVPQPDFLDRTLGYFTDPRVAFVQLPQEFYNIDSIQHERTGGGEVWHEQALFYRVIQPGKNRWNAAFWCGSPSIIRRAALEAVGGVATETITEDIHTSIRLHAAGWKSIYHRETLAYGIAPQTLLAFTIQRLRWAQGAMQLFRSPDNPLTIPGLTLAQRLNYLASMLTYFDPYQKLIFLATPSVILVTGALPLRVSGLEFLIHWIPFIGLATLVNVVMGRGVYRVTGVEKYNHLKLFVFLRATLQLFRSGRLTFKVTPKGQADRANEVDRRLIRPNVALFAVQLAVALLGLANLKWGLTTFYDRPRIALMAIFWVLFNATILAHGFGAVMGRLYRRRVYRFPVHLDATVRQGDQAVQRAVVQDIALYGARLEIGSPIGVGSPISLELRLPDGPLAIPSIVANSLSLASGWQVGLLFGTLHHADRCRLVAFLFVVAPRLQQAYRRWDHHLDAPDKFGDGPLSLAGPVAPFQ